MSPNHRLKGPTLMKTRKLTLCGALALLLGLALQAGADKTPGYNNKIPPGILTPDSVETRIGTLQFIDGQPDDATVVHRCATKR